MIVPIRKLLSAAAALCGALSPCGLAHAQFMASANFKVSTQAMTEGGSPTADDTDALSSTSFKTVLATGGIVDNLKTTASRKIAEGYIPTIGPLILRLATTTLPRGTRDVPYDATLLATGGTQPYTWNMTSGSLPVGLTLNAASGAISGVPVSDGVSTFTASVTDSSLPAQVNVKQLTIAVAEPGVIVNAGLNTPYNVSANGFVPDGWQEYTWQGYDSAGFTREFTTRLEGDAALSLDNGYAPWRGGVLQHIPVVPGRTFTASINAIMASTEAGDYNVEIGIGIAHGITTDPNNIAVSHLKWDNQIDLRVWNTFQASLMPASDHVTVFLIAWNKWAFSSQVTFDLGASSHDIVRVVTTGFPAAVAGLPFSAQLQAAGGVSPYTWSIISGSLPGGLVLNSATGTISGIPTTMGEAIFTVRATDAALPASTAAKTLSLSVVSPVQILSTSPLPRASLGRKFGFALKAAGGTPPVLWSVVSGALPPGLVMGADGIIEGEPSVLGSFAFTVRASDSTGPPGPTSAEQEFSVTVGNVQLTTGSTPRSRPAIIYNPNVGESLLVYQEETAPANFDIMAQRLAADLTPTGPPIVVSNGGAHGKNPVVSYSDTSNRYAVAYEADSQIELMLLDDQGKACLPAIRISESSGTAREPVIAWRPRDVDDRFIIVWSDNRNGNYALYSEARTWEGALVHDDVLLRSAAGVDVVNPAIAHNALDEQNLVVASEGGAIVGFVVDGDAIAPVTGPFIVQAKTGADNVAPDVVYASVLNRYFAVWQDGRNGASDPDVYGVLIFANGTLHPPGPTVVISAGGIQSNPRVTYQEATDSFVAVWEHQTANGDIDIFARGLPNVPYMYVGPAERISTPTDAEATETTNEFEPAITTNTGTELAQIVWRDDRTGMAQIYGDTKRDFSIISRLTPTILVEGGTSKIQVELFDFEIYLEYLDSLKIMFHNNGRSFIFGTYGRVVEILEDRVVVEFDIPTSGFIGQTEWINASAITGPDEETPGNGGDNKLCGADLISIEVTTDHDRLLDNSKDWTDKGPRFDKVEWKKGRKPKESVPFTHSKDQNMTVKVTVKVTDPCGAPQDRIPFTLDANGPDGPDGDGRYMDFDTANPLTTTTTDNKANPGFLKVGLNVITTTSVGKTPNKIVHNDQAGGDVVWGLTLNAQCICQYLTKHQLYITAGAAPSSGSERRATVKRIDWTTMICKDSASAHDSATKIHEAQPDYDPDITRAKPLWKLIDIGKAQCGELAELNMHAVSLLGWPVDGDDKVVFVYPDIMGGFFEHDKRGKPRGKPGDLPRKITLGMTEVLKGKYLVYIDKNGKQNIYEGCFKYTVDGSTVYYGGGSEIFDSARGCVDHVVFRTEWFNIEIQRRDEVERVWK